MEIVSALAPYTASGQVRRPWPQQFGYSGQEKKEVPRVEARHWLGQDTYPYVSTRRAWAPLLRTTQGFQEKEEED